MTVRRQIPAFMQEAAAFIPLIKVVIELINTLRYDIIMEVYSAMKMREEFTCPLELVHDMIKGKWKPIILWRLRLGATSLAKLERDIDGITQKMLLEQLKELIDYGFVEKKSFEGYPLHVEYSLTAVQGYELLEALKIMQHIGIEYLKAQGMEDILIEKGVVPE